MATATGGRRNPITRLVLATADDVNGTVDGTQYLDLTGAGGCLIVAQNSGTAGTTGIDVVQFSRDGGDTWLAATQDNLNDRHLGLILEDGTPAAAANAALNAAGTEVDAVFSLGPTPGPFLIRVVRDVANDANAAAWTTGAPAVVGFRIG